MSALKQVNTSGISFKDLRGDGKFYVDKTMLIADILDTDDRGVYLFTRPRRFGKSTNISMLDAFFNIEYEGNDWFDGLWISEHHEYNRHKNAYPVVHLDFSNVDARDFGEFLGAMRTTMVEEFDRHQHILEPGFMRPSEKHLYDVLSDDSAPENKVWNAPRILSSMLERYHGKKAVILVDEYDRALTGAFGTGLLERLMGFMGNMMGALLKGNSSLQMAYVTGVMQIAKAGMFSGANNLSVNNVLSKKSDEMFGFTEKEVKDILGYFGGSDRIEEVRDWYDGYRFGDAEVYNPYSVMHYVQEDFALGDYWAHSGNDKPFRWMLDRTNRESFDSVADIISGIPSASEIQLDMTYDDLRMSRGKDLFSLMVMTGYLKAVPRMDGRYDLSVPNNEVMGMVDRILKDVTPVDDELFREFALAARDGDASKMEELLKDLLDGSSYFDLKDESDYKLAVFICLRGIIWHYNVECERQKGNGRVDIVMTPKDPSVPPMIIELKVAESENRLETTAADALTQIHRKRYYHRMCGEVLLYGISFWGVVPKVLLERTVV